MEDEKGAEQSAMKNWNFIPASMNLTYSMQARAEGGNDEKKYHYAVYE
jgi:hypothetical protein